MYDMQHGVQPTQREGPQVSCAKTCSSYSESEWQLINGGLHIGVWLERISIYNSLRYPHHLQ
jgi:hypothetical protein